MPKGESKMFKSEISQLTDLQRPFESEAQQVGEYGRRQGMDALAQYLNQAGLSQQYLLGLQAHPGYSQQEQQGMKMASTAPIAGSYRAAGEEAKRAAAVRGGSPGLAPTLMALAGKRGQDISSVQGGLQEKFGNARREDEAAAAGRSLQMPSIFQFPTTAGFDIYKQGQGDIMGSRQLRYGALSPLASRANQPGVGTQLANTAIQGAAQIGTSAVGAPKAPKP